MTRWFMLVDLILAAAGLVGCQSAMDARVTALEAKAAAKQADVPSVKLPATLPGDVGSFVRVSSETNGSQVRWYAASPGLNVFPADMLRDSRSTVVVANMAGEYRLIAYTALGDVPSEPAECRVVIGTPAPTPVPPQPVPPGPTPEPEPPPPDSDIASDLVAAMAQVKLVCHAQPKAKRTQFAKVWSDFASQLPGTIKTTGQLKAAWQAYDAQAVAAAGLQGVFPGFGAAAEAAWVKVFGQADTDVDGKRAKDFFRALAWAVNA